MRSVAALAFTLVLATLLAGGQTRGPPTITVDQLTAFLPNAARDRLAQIVPILNTMWGRYQIDTCQRQAAFLAHVAVTTQDFTKVGVDSEDGSKYEGAGWYPIENKLEGDGKRYRPRGALRFFGKRMYTEAGYYIKADLLKNPAIMETDDTVAIEGGAWYWFSLEMNRFADKHTEEAFNAGAAKLLECYDCIFAGMTVRRDYWRKISNILGCPAPAPQTPIRQYLDPTQSRVLIAVADGVDELEFMAAVDTLRRTKATVVVANGNPGATVQSMRFFGRKKLGFLADTVLSDSLLNENWDVIVVPGGEESSKTLAGNRALVNKMRDLKRQVTTKYIAACGEAAGYIFGQQGVAESLPVTTTPQLANLIANQARIKENVVAVYNVISGQGAGYAFKWAIAVAATAFGEPIAYTLFKNFRIQNFGEF